MKTKSIVQKIVFCGVLLIVNSCIIRNIDLTNDIIPEPLEVKLTGNIVSEEEILQDVFYKGHIKYDFSEETEKWIKGCKFYLRLEDVIKTESKNVLPYKIKVDKKTYTSSDYVPITKDTDILILFSKSSSYTVGLHFYFTRKGKSLSDIIDLKTIKNYKINVFSPDLIFENISSPANIFNGGKYTMRLKLTSTKFDLSNLGKLSLSSDTSKSIGMEIKGIHTVGSETIGTYRENNIRFLALDDLKRVTNPKDLSVTYEKEIDISFVTKFKELPKDKKGALFFKANYKVNDFVLEKNIVYKPKLEVSTLNVIANPETNNSDIRFGRSVLYSLESNREVYLSSSAFKVKFNCEKEGVKLLTEDNVVHQRGIFFDLEDTDGKWIFKAPSSGFYNITITVRDKVIGITATKDITLNWKSPDFEIITDIVDNNIVYGPQRGINVNYTLQSEEEDYISSSNFKVKFDCNTDGVKLLTEDNVVHQRGIFFDLEDTDGKWIFKAPSSGSYDITITVRDKVIGITATKDITLNWKSPDFEIITDIIDNNIVYKPQRGINVNYTLQSEEENYISSSNFKVKFDCNTDGVKLLTEDNVVHRRGIFFDIENINGVFAFQAPGIGSYPITLTVQDNISRKISTTEVVLNWRELNFGFDITNISDIDSFTEKTISVWKGGVASLEYNINGAEISDEDTFSLFVSRSDWSDSKSSGLQSAFNYNSVSYIPVGLIELRELLRTNSQKLVYVGSNATGVDIDNEHRRGVIELPAPNVVGNFTWSLYARMDRANDDSVIFKEIPYTVTVTDLPFSFLASKADPEVLLPDMIFDVDYTAVIANDHNSFKTGEYKILYSIDKKGMYMLGADGTSAVTEYNTASKEIIESGLYPFSSSWKKRSSVGYSSEGSVEFKASAAGNYEVTLYFFDVKTQTLTASTPFNVIVNEVVFDVELTAPTGTQYINLYQPLSYNITSNDPSIPEKQFDVRYTFEQVDWGDYEYKNLEMRNSDDEENIRTYEWEIEKVSENITLGYEPNDLPHGDDIRRVNRVSDWMPLTINTGRFYLKNKLTGDFPEGLRLVFREKSTGKKILKEVPEFNFVNSDISQITLEATIFGSTVVLKKTGNHYDIAVSKNASDFIEDSTSDNSIEIELKDPNIFGEYNVKYDLSLQPLSTGNPRHFLLVDDTENVYEEGSYYTTSPINMKKFYLKKNTSDPRDMVGRYDLTFSFVKTTDISQRIILSLNLNIN